MDKIKIAIIGTGFIANYHAKGLQAVPDAEIILSVDTNQDAAQKFAKEYNIKEIATDAMSLVNRKDLDAVIIGIPNKFHAPYAAEFLKNGKDVFLEKPMAMNAGEGKDLQNLMETTKQILMVGHMWRFDTEVNFMKSVVESGKLGKVIKTKGYGIHVNWGPEGWFTRKELAGGGALADMGVHAIDTVRYILGDPSPVRVWARIGTHYGDYDVDDSGIITIEWDNGTTSIIESGWWQPHMDMPEAGTQLFGTKGYGTVLPVLLKFKVEGFPGTFAPEMPEKEEHCDQSIYSRQMEHFIDCIKSRKQPSPGLSEGQTVLDIVDAAYLSSRKNEVIRIQNA